MMSIYQRTLKYFTSSNHYFQDCILYFATLHGLTENCGKEQYPFESCWYHSLTSRMREEGSGGWNILLEDSQIQDYFENIENEQILAAVIFAHWLGLPQSKIDSIRHSRDNGNSAWDKLAEYAIPKEDGYLVEIHGEWVNATRQGADLITVSGEVFSTENDAECRPESQK